ncbi:hypothetical protein M0805_002405, partial [Coniferiporia weirii]
MPSEIYADSGSDPGHGPIAESPPQVATPPQQGAPEPGSGTIVHEGAETTGAVPFKDQMVGAYLVHMYSNLSKQETDSFGDIGYAKSIRGKVLNKPETKATGDKILSGEMTAKDYFEQK